MLETNPIFLVMLLRRVGAQNSLRFLLGRQLHHPRMRCSLKAYRFLSFCLIAVLLAAAHLHGQSSTTAPSSSVEPALPGPPNPFLGSAPEAKPTAEVFKFNSKKRTDAACRTTL